MANNLFLSIPGLTDEKGAPQPGTVLVDSVPCLRISDFSFGVATAGVTAPGGPGKAEFSPLTAALPVDSCTPLFLKACAQGTHFATASVIVQTGGAGPTVTTEKYDLKAVAVRSLSVAGSPGGDQQSISLGYGALNITFTPLTAQGKGGTPSTGGFDIVTNTAS